MWYAYHHSPFLYLAVRDYPPTRRTYESKSYHLNTKFITNSNESTISVGLRAFHCAVQSFIITKLRMPRHMPSAME